MKDNNDDDDDDEGTYARDINVSKIAFNRYYIPSRYNMRKR